MRDGSVIMHRVKTAIISHDPNVPQSLAEGRRRRCGKLFGKVGVAALNALALSGGGARAAYHAGALKFVAELGGSEAGNPFPVISAVSGGAVGAAILATHSRDFRAAVAALVGFWTGHRSGDFYCGLPASRLGVAWRILRGGAGDGWIDTAPSRSTFSTLVDADRIGTAITEGALHAVSLGTYGYASQQTVHFFQGRSDVEPWNDGAVVSAHVRLGPEHLAAAFSIPLAFPPVRLHREYFCAATSSGRPEDAAVRLGARRVLSIDADTAAGSAQRRNTRLRSGLLQAAAHTVVSGFKRDNDSLKTNADGAVFRLAPSIPLSQLAQMHWNCVPGTLRTWLERVEEETAYQIASLLVFEPPYLGALIELGYGDASAQRGVLHEAIGHS